MKAQKPNRAGILARRRNAGCARLWCVDAPTPEDVRNYRAAWRVNAAARWVSKRFWRRVGDRISAARGRDIMAN